MDKKPATFKKESISIEFLVEKMNEAVGVKLVPLNDAGLMKGRTITESNLHRPGLALAGYLELFTFQRVQVLGNTETRYLRHLPREDAHKAFGKLVSFPLPCIILTGDNEVEDECLAIATKAGVPVLRTSLPSTDFMFVLRDFLSDQFATQQSIHGALVDVYGIGLLITGKPGIGKSEIALDLVERGHRLVADDVVIVTKKEEQLLMGSGTDLVQHYMEIRGLGLVDIRAMFGVRAIRFQKRVEVVVDLHHWDRTVEYTRLGMVDELTSILGVDLPLVKLPITPGKNVTVLCEVIAMNHLLRHYGYDPAEVFAERLAERIRQKSDGGAPARGIEYFEHDYE